MVMRGCLRETVQFQLDDAQQRRLSKSQQVLHEYGVAAFASSFVTVGDTIPGDQEEAGYLKGHGTHVVDGQLLATLCGVVERVNKLITVRPLRARYNAATGDVVIGRITEVGQKRWKVDINSKHDAQLMLSAVNLPGGIQRRRTAVDELNMRLLYEEDDLISSEVQAVHQEGTVNLHTRSLKYGKLEKGQLVKVPAYLIKRLSQHFHHLDQYGVGVIFGCNGYVWIFMPSSTESEQSDLLSKTHEEHQATKYADHPIIGKANLPLAQTMVPLEVREKICRLANSVRVLSRLSFLIYPASVINIYEASIEWGTDIKDMLSPDFYVKVVELEASRRSKKG